MDTPIIRYDHEGVLDEFIAVGAEIHLERMDNSAWWMRITVGDHYWDINLGAIRQGSKGFVTIEEDA